MTQALLCDNGNCHSGTPDAHTAGMEIDEIKRRMFDQNVKQADIANLLGIDPTGVSKAMNGRRKFTYSEMLKIEQLLGGASTKAGDPITTLPVIGQVAAGQWTEAVQHPQSWMPVPAGGAPKRGFALQVAGDSMDKVIADGGTVIVDPDDKALYPGRYFVVLNEEGAATFKQFLSEPARLAPCSTNPTHLPIQIGDGTPFTIVGRVVGAYAKL